MRNDKDALAPPIFNNPKVKIALWPSSLALKVNPGGAAFQIPVRVYSESWLPLPGSSENWPQQVQIDGAPGIVIEKEGRPAMKVEPGAHNVSGVIPWDRMPQRIVIPPEIGILNLTMNGAAVEVPNRDEGGFLWLKRNRVEEEAEKEFLDAKVYRVLEDGIPMWLRTDIEISVAGKSREEELGHALPEGWQVASVESKIPCAIDDAGKLRVQVRAGKWTVSIVAFRSVPAETVGFGSDAAPIAEQEIIGFQPKPDFRLIELRDVVQLDVSQTTFPEKWRKFPVYQWDTSQPFRIEEKMRGMGFQKPAGLTVDREFWLDDEGDLMTFRDRLSGNAQQVWRLDASPGQTLGAVRMNGEGQLITKNPLTGESGIEVRQRVINIEAVGRIADAKNFPASGWQADLDKCDATLHLPPGWRVLALFGAEWVRGDWLTNWTLLDLFLLLVFAMAVGKLWGWIPAVIAILGFGLTFHEPGAPKYVWFLLLVPLAILRVGLSGKPRILAEIGKYFAIAMLLIILVPFIGKQVQGVIYPQLEPGGFTTRGNYSLRDRVGRVANASSAPANYKKQIMKQEVANLKQDLQARIQTGPAVPSWTWREINFGWRGPVTESEQVRVLLIPPGLQRVITIFRVLLLILLVAILLGAKRLLPRFLRRTPGAAVIGMSLLFLFCQDASAQGFPSQPLLDDLRKQLLETPDVFPKAAEIPDVKLEVGQRSFRMHAEIHVAVQSAVPLPGKLPSWSPVSVTVDGTPAVALARNQGFLWIALEAGTHTVEVEGLLPGATEWSWSFLLQPRKVTIDAPGWNVAGIKPNGVPEKQVFFVLKSPAVAAEAAYDRKDFTPAVAVERDLEIGLIWQVRTTLTRLSSGGKAVALSIPLLPGERVLSSNVTVENGLVQARLGAGDRSVTWESELPRTESIELKASEAKLWVERWKLFASPVWNVSFEGLAPVYEPGSEGLKPVWRPWPGENATLLLSKPEAVPGATMTVRKVEHTTKIGSRQRISQITVNLQASLGQDFVVDLPQNADVTRLKIGDPTNPEGTQQPVRRDGSRIIIPVKPGEQIIHLEWKTARNIGIREVVDQLEFPVESSNIETTITVPADRWVIWANGPLRGPAVRLWSIVLLALIGAFVLGRLSSSPLKGGEWGLLAIGLTQVHPLAVLVVICWFFLIAWRGTERAANAKRLYFNSIQILIILTAIPVIAVFLFALQRGLLGTPQMMVQGNNSSSTVLRWFAQRTESVLPEAEVVTVSIWFYRLLMLAWALWLAVSALRWVRWGWEQFSRKTLWKSKPPKDVTPGTPPPLK
ncbi:MAG: hypothetical protein P1V20_26995 [Verrucomicrobiales bacterium]|nr:hypothetical protein [Verrucomicrobiales bacterium]